MVDFNKFEGIDSVKLIIKLIVAISTMAIVSMDLGIPYNRFEQKIYTSSIFQIITVISIAFLVIENLKYTLIMSLVWLLIKYLPL